VSGICIDQSSGNAQRRTRRAHLLSEVTHRLVIAVAAALATLALVAARPLAAQEVDSAEIVRGDPSTNLVALTFDAGNEGGGAAPRLLDLFRERGIHVTFFLSGQWVVHNPELAQQMLADGHELANHSYSHPDLTHLSESQIVYELDYTDQVVFDATGGHTRPFFRPPFGARNRRVLDIAAASGFRSVYWTLDSGDWLPRATAAAVAGKILRYAEPGDIVVEHVGADASADALPVVLDEFAQRGWQVGTVSEVLGLAPQRSETAPR
jgi:peptidoglycan/xylan/chitin deacetylase (PgdA/CDA1 family)